MADPDVMPNDNSIGPPSPEEGPLNEAKVGWLVHAVTCLF